MKKVEIAKELGFSRQYLDQILRGKQKTISESLFIKLHEFFPNLRYEKINEVRYRILRGDSNDINNDNN